MKLLPFSDYLMYMTILFVGAASWEMMLWIKGEDEFMFWIFVSLIVINTVLLKLLDINKRLEKEIKDYEDETEDD